MVIAIMGILAALALPTIRGMKPNAKVVATRQLLDAVGRARQLALSQRTPVYMVFLSTNFFGGLGGADLAKVQPLLDKQLIGYAYVTLRSVGDQPGAQTPHYLSAWKTLPEGAFISPFKFRPSSSPIVSRPGVLGPYPHQHRPGRHAECPHLLHYEQRHRPQPPQWHSLSLGRQSRDQRPSHAVLPCV